MRKFTVILLAICCGVLPAAAGTPAQAKAVRESYEKSMEAWALRMKLAKTQAEREAAERPSAEAAAKRMWTVIGGNLASEWAIEPAAWFVQLAARQVTTDPGGEAKPMFRDEIAKVQQAVGDHHLKSPALAPMCMALVAAADQPSLILLRKIEKQNPDKKVSGVAALGIAMLAKDMGDDPRVMRERLSMLRKAIIDAADVELANTTVAELAEEELYIIMNLSKGQTAPELTGEDSGGRPMKLSGFSDKVVLLVFWNSGGDGPDALIEWVNALRKDSRFEGKEFEVVGVNCDPRESLREMQADGRVSWPNFSDPGQELAKTYRVGSWPVAYVLGKDRKIHYVGSVGTFAELTAAAVLSED